MRLNFFRRFRIVPGLWLNLSKRSVSATMGVRGLKATIGSRGKQITAGLPGTGLSVTKVMRKRTKPADDTGRRLLEKALRGKGRSRP